MPDDGFNWGLVVAPPTAPPTTLWPTRNRPEIIVDCWAVMLADPQGNLIGIDTSAPLGAFVYAERAQTRSL